MFVRKRVPSRSVVAECRVSRSCWAILAAIGSTLVVLWLALFDIDPTPRVPPNAAVGLTVGVGIALAAQVSALMFNLYDKRRVRLRRLAAEHGIAVVPDRAADGVSDGETPCVNYTHLRSRGAPSRTVRPARTPIRVTRGHTSTRIPGNTSNL